MRKTNIMLLMLSCISLGLLSCKDQSSCGYIPNEPIAEVSISIERLESDLLNIDSPEDLDAFVKKNPVVADLFLRQGEYPTREIFFQELLSRFNNPYLDSLKLEIEQSFSDLRWLEKELSDAFSLLQHYYPEVQIPHVKTVATGFDHDLHVSDSLIIIGLDYYLGKEAKFRPQGVFNYILKRYDRQYIVPSIMLLYGISSDFNAHNKEDNSVLSDMISYGKAFYFAKRMLPCTADSILIWYDSEEMSGINQNKDIVWAHFLDNGLLFETSHLIKKKYLDERPKTFEIGTDCPPRVATWLGWEIVKKYTKDRPDLTLQQLMQIADARKLFDDAKYRP